MENGKWAIYPLVGYYGTFSGQDRHKRNFRCTTLGVDPQIMGNSLIGVVPLAQLQISEGRVEPALVCHYG